MNATCPFCGQTVEVINTPGVREPTFGYHKKDDKPCNGWGKSIAKAEELREAVKDMLLVIMQQYYPEMYQAYLAEAK